jgi:chemotaxis protein CheC
MFLCFIANPREAMVSKARVKLNKFEMDALGEIGNIGASHAANSLSRLIGGKVEIQVPELDTIPMGELLRITGGEEEKVAGVYARLREDISGTMILLFPLEDAYNLADLLMGRIVGSTKALNEMDISAIQEVGNIMISSFANAMSDFLGLKIMLTPTLFASDSTASLLDTLVSELGTERAIFFTTSFKASSGEILGYLVMCPDPGVFEKIFQAIKKRYGF